MNGQTQQQQRVRVLPEISKLTLNEGRLKLGRQRKPGGKKFCELRLF
jgi:hypothetical protein